MNLRVFFLSLLIFISLTAWSQSLPRQVLATGGKISEAGGISLSWTVGQPGPVATYATSTLKLTQGFQQGDEWWVSINGNIVPYTKIKVYPNPSTGKFIIEGTLPAEGISHYIIIDAIGNLIKQGEFASGADGELMANIDISGSAPGFYFLKLFGGEGNQKYICSFKLTLIQTNNQ